MGIVDELKKYGAEVKQTLDAMNNASMTEVNYVDTMLSNPQVLAEHILHQKCISGTLTIPVRNYELQASVGKTVTIPFYLSNDVSLGFRNDWQNLLNLESLQTLSSFINQTSSVLGEASNVTMQSEAMSAQIWKGSNFDGFNLDCLFVCTNRKLNTLKILNVLTATCLPTKWAQQPDVGGVAVKGAHDVTKNIIDFGVGLGKGLLGGIESLGKTTGNSWDMTGAKDAVNNFATSAKNYVDDMGMIAPLNYGLKQGKDNKNLEDPLPNSTVTLHLGEYFKATNLLVESLSGITLSKEIVAPVPQANVRKDDLYKAEPSSQDWGFPLYLKCQIKLRPHSMMHFTKWNEYFTKTSYQHDYPTATIKDTQKYLSSEGS